ncbi:MAG: fructose-bisphosphatase class II [Firmicutes bacterium HGW-Firmicutes-8]|nr:MAG: fructose-bisphosphatase class II [Firmicutes bacterium HGW-Firmicutes-8]
MIRELTMEFARVTEAAAIAAARWMGRGDKDAADDAAVVAMRAVFSTVQIDGTVVIGEGEMDEAPMLFIGEKVGAGVDPKVDIAVDPVEGTNNVARGLNNAIAVLAASETGGFLHAPDMYMDKIAVGPKAKGRIHLDAPVIENLRAVAEANDKELEDLTVVILNRPRHEKIINEVRASGARIQLIQDGDVAPAVAAAMGGTGVDLLLGVGGAPEGVVAAAALKCLGGEMQGRLWPEDDEDVERAKKLGIGDIKRLLTMDDLVKTDDVVFAATGITDGDLVQGVRFFGNGARTHTVVMRSVTGTLRFIDAIHRLDIKPFTYRR